MPWSWVVSQLDAAEMLWVIAPSAAHPHPRPVWGVWLDDAVHLSVGSPELRRSLTAGAPPRRHCRARPRLGGAGDGPDRDPRRAAGHRISGAGAPRALWLTGPARGDRRSAARVGGRRRHAGSGGFPRAARASAGLRNGHPAAPPQPADSPLRAHAALRLRARCLPRATSPRTWNHPANRSAAPRTGGARVRGAERAAPLGVRTRGALRNRPRARCFGRAVRERREDRSVSARSASIEGTPHAGPRSRRPVRRGRSRSISARSILFSATRPARCDRCAIWPASR